jgi:AraC-like DNA-binding protein
MTITHNTIAISQVTGILQGARRKGMDTGAILRRSGISPALPEAPLSRVSQAQYTALIRTLRRTMRDELWGLAGKPVKIGAFSHCCRLLIHCRTLDEAMRTGFGFYRLLVDDFVVRLQVEGGVARVTLQSAAQPDACLSYLDRTFLFFTFGLSCWLVARRIPLLGVDYCEPEPAEGSETYRLFQAPVAYNQPHYALRFEARWLELPVVQNVQSLREFLRQAPASLLVKYRDQASITERIRRLLRRHINDELPSLDAVGKALSMTPQTLRRRLREEGQGYQAIKDDLRRDIAIEYLAQPELSLIEIANLLGYSEPSTFHRAFKSWTGVAPGEYRSTRLGQARS